jgi:serine/threonine protein kinase
MKIEYEKNYQSLRPAAYLQVVIMDTSSICYNCFKNISTGIICPLCGYAKEKGQVSAHHLPPGTILQDKYLMGPVIGQGGFGITYLAIDIKLDQKLAIKEYFPYGLAARIPGSINIDSSSGEINEKISFGLHRFLEETKMLARFFEHPNIITVRDYFKANGTAYMVMNYIDGLTLEQYLYLKGGKISFDQALGIMMPVLDTLAVIHEEGIMHRDISPDNLIIDCEGRIVLIDFGAARQAMGQNNKSISVIQ